MTRPGRTIAQAQQAEEGKLDPLYVIFEQHLYNFQDSDSDRKTFIGGVLVEYLTYLRKLGISVPKSLEPEILNELAAQVNTMLVKKIYGCLSIKEYQIKAPSVAKRRVRAKYSKLKSTAGKASSRASKTSRKSSLG